MNRIELLRAQVDRVLAIALSVGGLLALLIGYVRISGTPYPAEQLPLVLSAGVGSLFLLGLGATLWLSADLRDEWVKLDELAANDAALMSQLAGVDVSRNSWGPQVIAPSFEQDRVRNGQTRSPQPEPKPHRARQ